MLTFILVSIVAVSSHFALNADNAVLSDCTKESPCYELDEHGLERPFAMIGKHRFYIGGTK